MALGMLLPRSVPRLAVRLAASLVFAMTLTAPARAVESLPPGNAKYRAIKTIFDNIARAFGDGSIPPKLIVRPVTARGGMQVAYYYPGTEGTLTADDQLEESYIAIDEKVYDLLATLGSDRENGLAVLLAHEMAHYYRQHGWVGEFGNAFADTEMGKKMQKTASAEEVIKIETEADYYGGFYGYLAGYNTLGLAPRVIDIIYRAYDLPDKLDRYPSRAERKAIAARTEANLRRMCVIFDAGNRLLLLKKYEEAARLFDYIGRSFPSREIFNNAGVARAMAALRLFDPHEVPFAYPFEFDAETRLRGATVLTKGNSENTAEHRNALLRKAVEDFTRAIDRDGNYAAACVNLAAAYDLLGERALAVQHANRGLELAERHGEQVTAADALIVRGIAAARNNEKGSALADFTAARKAAEVPADFNAAVVQDKARAFAKATGKEIVSAHEETIGTVSPDDARAMEPPDVNFSLRDAAGNQPPVKVSARQQPDWEGMLIEIGNSRLRLLATPRHYRGESGRGIRIGSSLADVIARYGEPTRVVSARQGAYHVYGKNEIIFAIAPDKTVSGWLIYIETY
ncbi:MAG TPA: hypothetical protein VI298_05885 [Geobacteraceae bacterium]